jgi:hypothetical protein
MIIQLDASGKQGRYVRIQLLGKNYLSLAEVQVIGVDPEVQVVDHLWYWLCYYLRIHHQCCHLLHSQQQRGCGVDIYWIV